MRYGYRSLAIGVASLFVFASTPSVTNAQEAPKPGPEHEILKRLVGQWEGKAISRMAAGEEPTESTGFEEYRLACGGLWLISDYKASFSGQSFEGHGVTGYDTAKKKYVGTWVDSMTTSVSRSEGTYDEATNTISYTNTAVEGGKEVVYTSKMVFKDDDHHSFVMFAKGPDGKKFERLRIDFTRKGAKKAKRSDPFARLVGTWEAQVDYGEEGSLDYDLRFAKEDDGLKGFIISPRSGEHNLKSVTWKDGTLRFIREMEGFEVVFEGRLTDQGLKGDLALADSNARGGSWTAKKK